MSIIEEDSAIVLAYKKMFGLSNVENTIDIDKILNNAEIAELSNKLDLIGGTLTGALYGTNITFTNDLTLNTSDIAIKMDELYELIQTLQSQISSLLLTSSILIITSSSSFPIKIPFSSSTIDQIIYSANTWTKQPYYFSTGSFRPFGMTHANQNGRVAVSWAINKNTVNRDVWKNNWTVVTRVWYTKRASGISVKFGEKWDRWNTGSDGIANNGDTQVFSSDILIPTENIYIRVNYPMGDNPTDNHSNMQVLETNNLLGLANHWMIYPEVTTIVNGQTVYGGVYIIISYDKTAITIKFCTSDGTVYYYAKSVYNPLTNDRRPFHIYSNVGIPIWYFGIVLTNTQGNTPETDIQMFKDQFGLIY